jgi:hypothetical protein
MTSKAVDNRSRRRRENVQNGIRAAGAQLYYPCKVYDGDGNLIREVSPDEQMAKVTNVNKWQRKSHTPPTYRQLSKTSARVRKAGKEGKGLLPHGQKVKGRE